MINLYKQDDLDFTKNGTAVLQPASCLIKEQAGGAYELTMVNPLDRAGRWKLVSPGDIIKAPVPITTIESAITGENVDIYGVKTSGASIYAKPNAPSRIIYPAWVSGQQYPAMSNVTYNNHNYTALRNVVDSSIVTVPPDINPAWQAIQDYTSGSAVVAKPELNEELYLISDYNQYWFYVQTQRGIQGYIQKAYVEYLRTETVEEVPERTISEQLFRVDEINVDTKAKSATVYTQQVSYDLTGNAVKDCAVTAADAPTALARMRNALLFETDCIIATNLTDEEGSFTGDFSWKNPINALLEPDTGLVSFFKAKLIRDNWDIFLNKNVVQERGFTLRYGVNLRGAQWKRKRPQYNRIMPVAAKANGDPLYLPEIWIDSPLINVYPVKRVETLKIDGKIGEDDGNGGTWTEETLIEHMREQAQRRFDVDNVDKLSVSLDVDFIMLGDTAEYRQYKELQKLYLYDTVRVFDPESGIDLLIQVEAYEWDAIRKRYTKLTLANVFDSNMRNVGARNLRNGSVDFNKLSSEAVRRIKQAVS